MPLVSASTLKEYLPELTGDGADTELTNLIVRVEGAIALHLGFPVYDGGVQRSLNSQTYTVYLDGPMATMRDTVQIPFRPIINVTSVFSDVNREYGSDTEITNTQYEKDLQNGRIILKPTVASSGFDSGYRVLKIVLTAGFASAPSDLEHAICVYCSMLHRAKVSQGKASISQRDTTTTFNPRTIPPEVKQIIYRYRSSALVM
jgi:hypothetical protein